MIILLASLPLNNDRLLSTASGNGLFHSFQAEKTLTKDTVPVNRPAEHEYPRLRSDDFRHRLRFQSGTRVVRGESVCRVLEHRALYRGHAGGRRRAAPRRARSVTRGDHSRLAAAAFSVFESVTFEL